MSGGRVTDIRAAAAFFRPALNSTKVTVVSSRTGTRYTFRVARKAPRPDGHADAVWYVDLLAGSDNQADYAPLAVLLGEGRSVRVVPAKTRGAVSPDAPSMAALRWVVERVVAAQDAHAFAQLEVWHEGQCARCGRALTVPSSIELGLGPDCADKV